MTMTVWARDRVEPGAEREALLTVAVAWVTHQGPAVAEFTEDAPKPNDQGEATTTVTFPAPGRYVLRVFSSNFNDLEGSFGNQCCWTNGYVRVDVTP